MTRKDWGSAKELITILEEAEQPVDEELIEMARRFEAKKDREANERREYGGEFRGGAYVI